MRSFAKGALLTAAGLVVLVSVLLAMLLWSPWGASLVRAQLNAAITQGIAGELAVTHIESLSLSRVVAHGVTIRAPDGKPAIVAERASIDFDLMQLWSGKYGWTRAEIEGCTVHVSEDAQGKINMEETFKSPPKPGEPPKSEAEKDEPGSEVDLRTMVTSGCLLLIGGGSLPELRLRDLEGIMRVHVLPSGDVELRFDEYRGIIDKGLPTGVLAFEQVSGVVQTGTKRLLHFDGSGESKGAPVEFKLEIDTEPETRVKIDARFETLSRGSLRAMGVSAFSMFSPTLDLTVSHGQ